MKLKFLKLCILLLLCSSLAAQDSGENNQPREILLSEIAENIDQYRGSSLQLVLRLQYVYLDYMEISFYDEENINIQFDISGYEDKPLYMKSLNHKDRGRKYVVFCTINDVDSDGDIVATLTEYRPATLYSLP